MATFKRSPTPQYLVADAKVYSEDNATNLTKLGFITRIPGTLKLVSQMITQALKWDTWYRLMRRPTIIQLSYVITAWPSAGW
jgi:transposase